MITWNDIIEIITETRECTQADIAAQLEVSPSLLSKVKKNERKPPVKFASSIIYKRIFDPENPKSLSKSKTPNDELFTVKQIIETKHSSVKQDLGDLWNIPELKEFIICLLEMTQQIPNDNVKLLHILPESPVLIGREFELNRVREIFRSDNYAILHGDIEGIGTSQIALAYAHDLHKSGAWTVQQILCDRSDSLQTAFQKIQFTNAFIQASDQALDSIATMLSSVKSKTLIIIDNLNHPFTPLEREFFSKLVRSNRNLRFLITCHYDLQYDKHHQISVSTLEDNALLELYEYYHFENLSDHRQFSAENKEILEKLFNYVGKHTLTIKLLAILAKEYLLTVDQIYKALIFDFEFPKMNIEKDGIQKICTLQEFSKEKYNISSLSENEKNIMSYLAVIPKSGISIDLFIELTDCGREQIINLKRKSWILSNHETRRIWLHPMVRISIIDTDEVKSFWKKHGENTELPPQWCFDDLDKRFSIGDSDEDEDEDENEDENNIGGDSINRDNPEVTAINFENPLAAEFIRKAHLKREHLPDRSYEYFLMNQIAYKAQCISYLHTFIVRFSLHLKKEYREALNTLFTAGENFLDTDFSQVDISKLTFPDQSKHSHDTDE